MYIYTHMFFNILSQNIQQKLTQIFYLSYIFKTQNTYTYTHREKEREI